MSLSTKLVTLRKQKGLTQMDLAEKLQVSRQAISRWEVGAAVPSTENLKVLGDSYGVSVDYLLNDSIREISDCDRLEQPKTENPPQTDKGSKGKNPAVFYSASFYRRGIDWHSPGKKRDNEDESVLPMENMTVEKPEYDETVIFPME